MNVKAIVAIGLIFALSLWRQGHAQETFDKSVIVGHWDDTGYYIWDGPALTVEMGGNTWVDADTSWAILPAGEDLFNFTKVVSYEIVDTPHGRVVRFTLLAYPGVWYTAPDGFIYGRWGWEKIGEPAKVDEQPPPSSTQERQA